ncbi:dynamin family protein [Paraferrimonas sp. SM1919]|uniref:dynamin family protein n=1 Tax=Paraferrimonas sp. SM1919 TaxID=2662263 RepID=UPI0013D81BA4|nr:dynamin family protein [Paraferrimonas sp. SM1919]
MSTSLTITKLEELSAHLKAHEGAYGSSAAQVISETNLPTVEEFKSVVNNQDDTLEIGIVGRVKAGKSSIVNTLFFEGEEVLPKAATPMTAALTILSYDEEASIEVELYNQNDIKDIELKSREYERKRSRLIEDYIHENSNFIKKLVGSDIERKAVEYADSLMKDDELSFYLHCYNDIQAHIDNLPSDDKLTLKVDDPYNINKEILDYVGSDGKYTPFTKSVHIRLPLDSLKGIKIVDTPGINDPVASRESITRRRLKSCDVVFIVTPCGQFLNNEDVKLIDRVANSEKARELYIVGSKLDSQLFNMELQGGLPERIDHIQTKLSMLASRTFRNLKATNLEVDSMYDELIEEAKERVILVSSYAETMCKKVAKDTDLSADEQLLLDRLQQVFPDDFKDDNSSMVNLSTISKYTFLNTVLANVNENKYRLIEEANEAYSKKISKIHLLCKDKLQNALEAKLDALDDYDVAELKQRSELIQSFRDKITDELNDFYADSVRELKIALSKFMKERISASIDNFNVLTQTTVKSGGACSASRTVEQIRTGAAFAKLELLIQNVEDHVSATSEEVLFNWKKKLKRDLTTKLEPLINDDVIELDMVRSILSGIYPENLEINYKAAIPKELQPSGTLSGRSARNYAQDMVAFGRDKLKLQTRQDIKEYIAKLEAELMEVSPAKHIFNEFEQQNNDLLALVGHKEEAEELIEAAIESLEGLSDD